jgi:hypothetical protein
MTSRVSCVLVKGRDFGSWPSLESQIAAESPAIKIAQAIKPAEIRRYLRNRLSLAALRGTWNCSRASVRECHPTSNGTKR